MSGCENNSGAILGRIHSTESFGSVDGPGVRFVVFLQGCRMRCQYCHNPDTWELGGGTLRTPEDVLAEALRYRPYWGKDGGITVSGGEALLQMDFMRRLFSLAKEKNVHTCLDTAGNPFTREEPFFSEFKDLMADTDLVLLDIKMMDDEAHRALTGCGNSNILDMARFLSENGTSMWIRHVLVPGLTDSDEELSALCDFLGTLKTVEKVEVLPYHTLGIYKWKELGIPYALDDILPPTEEEVRRAEEIIVKLLNIC
ncbi:MAG: pyruvate formate lyase-activating protein [Clostridiales bacterium]|nr:pyruvate formate lyase-activating protein [Clostridiales bacterium]